MTTMNLMMKKMTMKTGIKAEMCNLNVSGQLYIFKEHKKKNCLCERCLCSAQQQHRRLRNKAASGNCSGRSHCELYDCLLKCTVHFTWHCLIKVYNLSLDVLLSTVNILIWVWFTNESTFHKFCAFIHFFLTTSSSKTEHLNSQLDYLTFPLKKDTNVHSLKMFPVLDKIRVGLHDHLFMYL